MKAAFPEIDVEAEHKKMLGWLQTPRGKGKRPSQDRFFGWLSRAKPSSTPPKADPAEEPPMEHWMTEEEEALALKTGRITRSLCTWPSNKNSKPRETHGS